MSLDYLQSYPFAVFLEFMALKALVHVEGTHAFRAGSVVGVVHQGQSGEKLVTSWLEGKEKRKGLGALLSSCRFTALT